jgi:myo-inositol-1(or 4)-monophosphatase
MVTEEYKDIMKAAVAGGRVAAKYFGKALEIEGKSMPSDFRTKADMESEAAILKVLRRKFPDYNIFSEETGNIDKSSAYTFVIDPLDGTNNFVLGIPNFSTGIALMKHEEIIFSVAYNPLLKNIYYAEKGMGAFMNGKKITVNNESEIKNSTVSYVINYNTDKEHGWKVGVELEKMNVKRIMRNWSVILDFCLLATGKLEAIIVYGDIPLYDIATGKLIAKEAGAFITDYAGNKEKDKNTTFLATNGIKIHKEILKVL